MITRFAFFEGTVKPGSEQAFDDYVNTRLRPLWTQFPGALAVRVSRHVSRDEGAPPFAMILAVDYVSEAAMAVAMESPVRMESREVTKGLFEFFEGRIFHVNAGPLAPRFEGGA